MGVGVGCEEEARRRRRRRRLEEEAERQDMRNEGVGKEERKEGKKEDSMCEACMWVSLANQVSFGKPIFRPPKACPDLPQGYVAKQVVISLPGILLE